MSVNHCWSSATSSERNETHPHHPYQRHHLLFPRLRAPTQVLHVVFCIVLQANLQGLLVCSGTSSATPLKHAARTWQDESPAGLEDGWIVSLMKETARVVWNSCKWQNSCTENLQPAPPAKCVKLYEGCLLETNKLPLEVKVWGDILQFDSQSLELLSWQVESNINLGFLCVNKLMIIDK